MTKRYEHPGYEYKSVDVVHEPEAAGNAMYGLVSMDKVANRLAEEGWRTVSAMIVAGTIVLLVERVKPTDYVPGEEGFETWRAKQRDPQS